MVAATVKSRGIIAVEFCNVIQIQISDLPLCYSHAKVLRAT
jgi:hypothetical protein